jgi:protein TonB
MANACDRLIPTLRYFGVLVLAATPSIVAAQEKTASPDETQEVVYDPVPIERTAPDFPTNELRAGYEGWVKFNFILSKTGEVTDAMIEDSSGGKAFETAAMGALRRWRYKPATIGGQPVEHSVQTIIYFQFGGDHASKAFVASFKEIQNLLAAKNVAKAKARSTT